MDSRRVKRTNDIEKVKGMLRRCTAEKREINFKDFEVEIMSKFKVSERTAKEYIKVSQYEIHS